MGELQAQVIKVGSKKFTESVILGEIISQLLSKKGYNVQHRKELGGTQILWQALLRGDLQLYPEYTGTITHEILQIPKLKDFEDLKTTLKSKGIGITAPFGFNNTYAMGMRRSHAKKLSIKTISDLKNFTQLIFGMGHEFLDRKDGWLGLKNTYQLNPSVVKGMDHDISYKAIHSKAIDVTSLYTTDAEIDFYDLIALKDDKDYFPRYDALIVYRLDVPPKVKGVLQLLEGKISEKKMIRLNADAKINGIPGVKVAGNFLKETFGIENESNQLTLYDAIYTRTVEHVILVSISLILAIAVSLPIGYFCSLSPFMRNFSLPLVGLIQTIPALALLVVMIPLFGIGRTPALIALFLYSLLPIVRGTYHGFITISKEIRESADALGLPPIKIFWQIHWPLALSSILNGVKTSAVINVGTATLGALIGAGGLGQLILKGIRLDNHELILAGAVPAAALALIVQWLFDIIEKIFVSKGLKL